MRLTFRLAFHATPWHEFTPLPKDNFVLQIVRQILPLSGRDALRQVRKLYRPA
jgi:hypothetical protein